MKGATLLDTNVLVVEDDGVLGPLMVRHLKDSGFGATWAASGSAANAALSGDEFQMIILDLMLPDDDGLSICRRIRATHDIPIIIVTAKGDTSDRIRGLEMGADDYLPKPFSLWELEARIKAVLRRSQKPGQEPDDVIELGPLSIHRTTRALEIAGCAIELTRSEFDLLERLASSPGKVFPREQLLDCIAGGQTEAFDRAVDTHISNLRKKIERDPKSPELVKTVWGIGYKLEKS